MPYVADHGQTLSDKSCKIAFHGHNTQYEFHVPASPGTRTATASACLASSRSCGHRKARLSTGNMFHTVLDMADIRYPGESLERSFVNPP